MEILVRFDQEQYSKLCLETNKKDTVDNEESVTTDILAVPDTGVNGHAQRHLFPTGVILRTANCSWRSPSGSNKYVS